MGAQLDEAQPHQLLDFRAGHCHPAETNSHYLSELVKIRLVKRCSEGSDDDGEWL